MKPAVPLQAILAAIGDKCGQCSSRVIMVIMVVGAGYGGLVDSCLAAMEQHRSEQACSTCSFQLVAVEKNPKAVDQLCTRTSTDPHWGNVKVGRNLDA